MDLTEKDFIDKMIEIANDGHEYMDQLQCVYFTWNEFFNPQHDKKRAFEVASQIFSASSPDKASLRENDEFWNELKAERIRQYEAYAEGVVDRESYLRNKKELNEKIEKVQTKYEQIQAVTTAEDDLMKDVKTVEKNAEEVNILKRMTRNIAEIFVEEITIYDSEKIEVKFVFDDLLVDMANRIEKKKEGIA